MNAKLQNSNKPKYVSKAERAAIAAQEAEANAVPGSDESSDESTSTSDTDSIANSETK